jgi:hypothetical protein
MGNDGICNNYYEITIDEMTAYKITIDVMTIHEITTYVMPTFVK